MGKPLTTGELRDMTWQADGGVHIWVKLLNTGAIYAAVTDLVDDLNVVALWCAESENDWLREHTYGIEWLAYLERPVDDELITYLDTISVAWREQFESPNSRGWAADELEYLPQLPMVWTIKDDILYLDGTWICPVKYLTVEKLRGCWEEVTPYSIDLNLTDGILSITLDEDGKGGWQIWSVERRWWTNGTSKKRRVNAEAPQ